MPSKQTGRSARSKLSVSLGQCWNERAISSVVFSMEQPNPKRWIVTQPLPLPGFIPVCAQQNGVTRLFKRTRKHNECLGDSETKLKSATAPQGANQPVLFALGSTMERQ